MASAPGTGAAAAPMSMAAAAMPCMNGMMMPPLMGVPGMMPGMGMVTMPGMMTPQMQMALMMQQQQMQTMSMMSMMQQQMAAGQQQQQQQQQRQYEDMLKSITVGASASTLASGKALSAGTSASSSLSTADINSPAYRPPNSETLPGVTDKRWDGRLSRWFDDQGFGFIDCEELSTKFKQDVFLHNNQRAGFNRGDGVNFAVFLNFRGKPQATDLRRRTA